MASFLKPGWQFQRRTKAFQSLVSCKAGRISRDLKQHPTGFTEVDGMEILAIDDRRNVIFEFREGFPPLHLLGICCRSPCHVMDGPHGYPSRSSFGRANQIDDSTGPVVTNRIAEAVSLLGNLLKSQRLC